MSVPPPDLRAEFLARAERGGIVPVVREVVLDADTPVAALAKIARPPFAFLLESLVGGERWARYTFMGTEPREVWRYHGAQVERWTPATGWEGAGETADPIGHLALRLRALPSIQVPGGGGGCRASRAAPWATWATIWSAPSSGSPPRPPTRSACPTPS